jgi:hypothetical protein
MFSQLKVLAEAYCAAVMLANASCGKLGAMSWGDSWPFWAVIVAALRPQSSRLESATGKTPVRYAVSDDSEQAD